MKLLILTYFRANETTITKTLMTRISSRKPHDW